MDYLLMLLPFIGFCVVVFYFTSKVPDTRKSCGCAPDSVLVEMLEKQSKEQKKNRENKQHAACGCCKIK